VLFENKNLFQRDELKHFLRQKGLKYTRQREAIWSAFRYLEAHHPSTEEIFNYLKSISPGVSWATLYRTLRRMRELGVIVERDFGDGHLHYEVGGRDLAHGHLVCNRCGKVIELEGRKVEDFWRGTAEKYGFEISRKRIEGFGLCRECEKKRPKD
jgi:Fur family ferric uptake transcriptional regulator